MALTHVLLFFHLLGAFCFFGGAAVVGVLQLAAIRRERPSEIYALLRLAPYGAALVGAGALLTLVFGIGLAQHEGVGFSATWIQAALGLWVAAIVLGGYGGRTARRARHLAQQLASGGDVPSPELRSLVAARGPLWASYASGLLLLAIVGLMVWQPGSSGAVVAAIRTSPLAGVPASVERKVISGDPLIAYLPTRAPAGYSVSQYTASSAVPGYTLYFTRGGNAATELAFSVGVIGACSKEPGPDEHFRINGALVFWSGTETDQEAWECHDGVSIDASASIPGGDQSNRDALDLATLVGYAKRVR